MVRTELYADFARDGDSDGDIYRKLELLDEVWKQFTIAIDNIKD